MESALQLSQSASDETRAALRQRSKGLFGNLDRLEVMAAIARSPDRAVNATDLSWDLRIAHNRVRSQLIALADLGLLADGPPGPGKRWFIRQESRLWGACVDLYEKWMEHPSDGG